MSKTAFVTGTSRGIGFAVLSEFARQGWDVIAHARQQTEGFENTLAELAEENEGTITPVYFDMRDSAAMKQCVLGLKRQKTTIDALVNNAGIAHGALFQMTAISEIREVFEVNLFAHMELTQLLLRIMSHGNAAIVNVASVAGIEMRKGNSAYGVSKAALIAWTRVLQAELDGRVRVNAVAPGLTETDMAGEMENKLQAISLSRTLGHQPASPESIAKVICYLASDDASTIAGEVVKADGGHGI